MSKTTFVVDRGQSLTADYSWAGSRPGYEVFSRIVDIVISGAVLAILSPLWVCIGLLIRATSPGPVLFRRTVIGKAGSPFTYYKFRSMITGDDGHHRRWLREFITRDAPYKDGTFKVVADPRITPVGRTLRRFSLDEVPQLINVFKGDMSIVGPRPPIPYEFQLYGTDARRRLAVKPGITGLYQVTARSQVPFSRMLALDLDYIRRRSLWIDFGIMLRTIGVMLSGRGAS